MRPLTLTPLLDETHFTIPPGRRAVLTYAVDLRQYEFTALEFGCCSDYPARHGLPLYPAQVDETLINLRKTLLFCFRTVVRLNIDTRVHSHANAHNSLAEKYTDTVHADSLKSTSSSNASWSETPPGTP
jgi:hypothetical protein